MTDEHKKWIDTASLEQLLRHWRFALAGDPLLANDTGTYFSKVMFAKRDADPAAWTRTSKIIGWG